MPIGISSLRHIIAAVAINLWRRSRVVVTGPGGNFAYKWGFAGLLIRLAGKLTTELFQALLMTGGNRTQV